MSKIEQYKVEECDDHEISLSKVIGKKIIDIFGYVSMEFGDPTFKMTKVCLEDGTYLYPEGEHDMPYVTNGTHDIDDDVLQQIYDHENKEDAGEEGE